MYARRSFKVRFDASLAHRFFEAASALHKAGFIVDTMLPATLSVFGTFDAKMTDKKIQTTLDTKEIIEWAIDV